MGFEIVEHEHGDVLILELHGELAAKATRDLQVKLHKSVGAGCRALLVDFSQLESIDGAGLRALVMANERLEGEGGGLALCALSPTVRKVFEIAKMSRSFVIHARRADALAELRQQVRQMRIARLAGLLLRKKDDGPRGKQGTYDHPDVDRATLAIELLGSKVGLLDDDPGV